MADWPSDKELEEIYRKGSENHDFQYTDEAWENMESLLDKDKRRKFLIIFFVFIGLALSIGGFYYNNLSEKIQTSAGIQGAELNNKIEQTKFQNPNQDLSLNNSAESDQLEELQKSAVRSSNISKLNNSKSLNRKNLETNSNATFQRIEQSHTITKPSSPSTTNQLFKKTEDIKGSIENDFIINATIQNQSAGTTINQNQPGNKIENSSKSIQENLAAKEQRDFLNKLNKLAVEYLNIGNREDPTLPEKAILPIEKNIEFPKFFIGTIATVESSWTPNGEFSSIDGGIGIKINHLISNKFAISVGGSYIKDVYVAEQGDYKASQDFWKATGAPEYTQANCSMIELATGFSYYFQGINRNGFSASINLLSNFMLKEEYDYHFTEENNNFSSAWTMANNTWLNGIDFGANYKFDISNKWSIEAGPYIKVPLAGIGHGDVMLSSFGIRVFAGFKAN